jgi:hypothetical protein
MKILEPEFVEYIPSNLEDGVLYVSMKYNTTVHKCPCGCGEKVVATLAPTAWKIIYDGTVTLSPSIANGVLPCRSHYFIRNNKVIWARYWDEDDFDVAKKRDKKSTDRFYKKKKK